MTNRRILAASVLLCASACGASPAAPVAPPPLADGRYSLQVTAPSGFASCSPAWESVGLSARSTAMVVTHDGSDSIARAEVPGTGDVELRVHVGASGTSPLTVLEGTIRGIAVTALGLTPGSVGLGVTFAGPGGGAAAVHASMTGVVPAPIGEITGSMQFIDAARQPMTCLSAGWTLRPNAS